MKLDYEAIKILLFEKIAGVISEEDELYIDNLIQNNEETRLLWQDIQEHFKSSEAECFIEHVNKGQNWDNFKSGIKSTHSTSSLLVKLSIAAMLLITSGVGIYFYVQSSKIQSSPLIADVRGVQSNNVQLILDNGNKVDLSGADKQIELNDAQVIAGKKNLSFLKTSDIKTSWSTLAVPAKLNYKMVLPDGTEVWLNSLSTIKFPTRFNDKTREVYVSGEVFFKVIENKKQPFIVHTSLTDVTVLGTTFNVNSYEDEVCITSLVEGKITTKSKGHQEVIVTPGRESIFNVANGFDIRPFDIEKVTSWMNGVYYFNRQPLINITAVLHRWYDINVVFDNTLLSQEPFSGSIKKDQPLDVFLSNLEVAYNIKYYKNGNKIHITR